MTRPFIGMHAGQLVAVDQAGRVYPATIGRNASDAVVGYVVTVSDNSNLVNVVLRGTVIV